MTVEFVYLIAEFKWWFQCDNTPHGISGKYCKLSKFVDNYYGGEYCLFSKWGKYDEKNLNILTACLAYIKYK